MSLPRLYCLPSIDHPPAFNYLYPLNSAAATLVCLLARFLPTYPILPNPFVPFALSLQFSTSFLISPIAYYPIRLTIHFLPLRVFCCYILSFSKIRFLAACSVRTLARLPSAAKQRLVIQPTSPLPTLLHIFPPPSSLHRLWFPFPLTALARLCERSLFIVY